MAYQNYDEIEITRKFVFGTDKPSPDNYNAHIRGKDVKPASQDYDMDTYMNSGGGRFAYPSLFPAVEKFFNGKIPDREKGYTSGEIKGILGLTSRDFWINISQYGTNIGGEDFADRCWIFGNSPFELDVTNATYYVNNGIKRIEGLKVKALADNFDFESDGRTQIINNLVFNPIVDRYRLNRGEVTINFTGSSGKPYPTYTEDNFRADQKLEANVNGSNELGYAVLLATKSGYFLNIASDKFLSYRRGVFNVIYGNPGWGDDSILSAGAVEIAGPGLLVGGAGNDTLQGGSFDDELDGGDGSDKAVYKGVKNEYDIQNLPDGSIQITDKIPFRDGKDILKNIENIVFQKALAQDIAFVIDTTSSMSDDIDEVKARASEIINIVLGEKSDSPDSVSPDETNSGGSRIAVVGYNDPGTDIFLPFTDQPDIEQRKTAALNAINSISVSGGGDFPEVVNTGLIRALSGDAGKWRPEADVRRIILFGDAPPKDDELRAQVLALASNVEAPVSGMSSPRTMSIASDIETSNITNNLAVTRFALETNAQTKIPVEIFTILIGNNTETAADFESLATATGGKALNAADSSKIVDVIIEALGTSADGGIPSAENKTVSIITPMQNIINGSPNNDVLLGYKENDSLTGLEGNDTLYGGKENDILEGGDGDDQLWGDLGQDILKGGAGNDTFFLIGNSAVLGLPEQADVITDFQPGDTIGLASGLLLDQLVFEAITLQLDGGLPSISTAIKLGNNYLAIFQGVETSTLTPNVFIGV
ncbi:VWA domain-containing protein [Planktothrix agardhii]|uniref:Calmodulin-sensitive adenylate cyclase n=2 Tax=Planktothrix agardhii TaxID=1160 RepID=A0A073CIN0_PLAA1|nr:VWA domain-containing protein [Planktothrix agardhii]KEI67976.1 Calmodulin-sensitive adenylate cyclase [Planktothrix agardhii NIVA-CYA 126/8]CAD5942875.1 Calmodulin-sensitive adenylate cyclase [Planktothrix agardhii]